MRPTLRLSEFTLYLFSLTIIGVGMSLTALVETGQVQGEQLAPGLWGIAFFFALHIGLSLAGYKGDQLLLPLSAALVGIGLIFTQRLVSQELAFRQTVWLAIGITAFVATLFTIRRWNPLRRYKYTWAFLGLALVTVTLVLGKSGTPGGPRLWLDFGAFQFQPSEVLKVLLVVFFAGYLEDYRELLARGTYRIGWLSLPPLPYLLPLLTMWGFSVLLLVVQKDLGAALLFFGIFLAMLYMASGRLLYVVAGLVAFVATAAVAYRIFGVVQERVDVWIDPFANASGTGYQIVQGLIALAAGGVFGVGLNYGNAPSIPAAHTDYVLAAVGEEMGLLGAIGLIAIYIALIYRGFRIALESRSGYYQLLAAGLTTVLALQTLVIVAGNLKLIPLTGITLPFVSYGGSSLLTNFTILALLLFVSEQTQAETLHR